MKRDGVLPRSTFAHAEDAKDIARGSPEDSNSRHFAGRKKSDVGRKSSDVRRKRPDVGGKTR